MSIGRNQPLARLALAIAGVFSVANSHGADAAVNHADTWVQVYTGVLALDGMDSDEMIGGRLRVALGSHWYVAGNLYQADYRTEFSEALDFQQWQLGGGYTAGISDRLDLSAELLADTQKVDSGEGTWDEHGASFRLVADYDWSDRLSFQAAGRLSDISISKPGKRVSELHLSLMVRFAVSDTISIGLDHETGNRRDISTAFLRLSI